MPPRLSPCSPTRILSAEQPTKKPAEKSAANAALNKIGIVLDRIVTSWCVTSSSTWPPDVSPDSPEGPGGGSSYLGACVIEQALEQPSHLGGFLGGEGPAAERQDG